MLISLIILLSGSAIITIAINSKFNAKASYERIENRYIAESGIDLAIGLFLNYLSNQDFILSYTKNEDGTFAVIDSFSPYLLPEIGLSENKDSVTLDLIQNECVSYLASVGFLDYMRDNGIEIAISTFNNKDNFKLSRMCIEPNFLISKDETITSRSKINPVFITIKSKYKGGEVLCSAEVSDLYVVREPFAQINVGESAYVKSSIDIVSRKVAYNNYQNYRRLAK